MKLGSIYTLSGQDKLKLIEGLSPYKLQILRFEEDGKTCRHIYIYIHIHEMAHYEGNP